MEGILPIIKNNSGCDYHRIIEPMRQLDFDFEKLKARKADHDILKDTKVIFFNRMMINDMDYVKKGQKIYGFKIVLDLDDYWHLNAMHPLYEGWKKYNTTERIIEWIKHADAVTVTTNRLADKVLPLNKNVYVVPNALRFGKGQFNSKKVKSDATRFMFAGGSSHVYDVLEFKQAFSRLNGLNNAQFVLAGYSEKDRNWHKIKTSFTLNGKLKNYKQIPFKHVDRYMESYMDSDVSLVPLESNIFTPYKSNIKILETGCKYNPVICSNVPPYSDEPNKNVILYAKNTREWVEHIKYCTNNPNFVKDKGRELGEYVRKHYDLAKVNILRKQLFEHLMQT